MTILLLGSGGREHALAWKLSKSPKLNKLYIAPGNPGTAQFGENVNIDIKDFETMGKWALKHNINMVVVGPEDPLVNGITDYFLQHPELKNIPVIGPSKQGAALEGSKDFAKAFMQKYKIPTAAYQTFTADTVNDGYIFLDSLKAPYVLKADGLAAGKGVLILNDVAEAKQMLKEMLSGKFGKASNKVVIEEYLDGIEVSVFVLTDGKSYKLLPEAKDYKRIGDGDLGLNTGGMGAVSPVPFANKEFLDKVCKRVVEPTIAGLQQENINYKGFIFIGLMNQNGEPAVIEYNVRMGDPETEAVMPRLNADLLDLFEGVATETLADKACDINPDTAVTIVCTSGGYPEEYEKGFPISGLNSCNNNLVFHAGTAEKNGTIITSGGRVLAITATGNNIAEAREKAYQTVSKLNFEQMYYRKDIGNDLLNLTQKN